jgi:antitoxin (DNA-binding transcriptional repressor) of toxin-antitoxin stability system
MRVKQKTLNASEFKARCLKILDNLDSSGITILKRGKPIAKVIPLPDRSTRELIGSMKGKIKIKGNVFRTGVKWDAES